MNILGYFIIIAISFSLVEARAGVVSYKPQIAKGFDGFFVSKGDYQDLRLNSKNKNIIKYWEVKSKNLSVQQVFENGKVKSIRFVEANKKSIKEIVFVRSGSSLKLVFAKQRKPLVMNYSGGLTKEIKCDTKVSAINSLEELGKKFEEETLYNNLQNTVINPVCKKVMTEDEYEKMTSALVEALSPKSKITACLKRESTADIFVRARKKADIAETKNELNFLALKYALAAQKYYEQPDSFRGNISCLTTPTAKTKGQCTEENGIQFLVPKNAGENEILTRKEFEKIAVHEIFHSLDVVNENVVEDLISVCFDDEAPSKSPDDATGENELLRISSLVVPQSLATSQASAEAATQNAPAAIPRTLAENEIPNAPMEEINRPFVDSDKDAREYVANPEQAAEKALAKSVSATTPILNFANKVMASFSEPAQASPIGSRSPASFGAKSVGVAKSTKSDDYEVKEEILLSDDKKTKQEQTPAKASSDSRIKTAERNNGKKSQIDLVDSTSELGRASQSGVDQADNRAMAARSTVTQATQNRGSSPAITSAPSSAKRSPSSTNSAPDREQLVTFFKDYNQAKQKVTEPGFQKTLDDNKISVVDRTGKVFGHPKRGPGVTIYLDTGTRYVRQE